MTGGDGDDGDRPERFADLLGDARPLAKGPRRVAPRPQATRPARRTQASEPRERFRWPDPAERLRAAAAGTSDAMLLALGRGEPPPEERVDLHGLRADAAQRLLGERIRSARRRGLRCVVVIHGRGSRSPGGEAVLRDALPDWLVGPGCAEHVLAFTPAPARLGGDGATLVRLRRG